MKSTTIAPPDLTSACRRQAAAAPTTTVTPRTTVFSNASLQAFTKHKQDLTDREIDLSGRQQWLEQFKRKVYRALDQLWQDKDQFEHDLREGELNDTQRKVVQANLERARARLRTRCRPLHELLVQVHDELREVDAALDRVRRGLADLT